ncbi:MAG: hypothetical protein DAHOPDDO_02481 [Ignavibacteriaceae bacterium]|nr:hypothetical protein [Ignavibacteriota bacterium]MBV6421207.1 hypothetical protein [Ignavibacteriaceae bacterium]MCE7855091.1 hypothetical protein [Ignavibacteria bacterium CHB3]GJQ42661.1 MAG: hypothetical protein JETCAE03_21590 [Ignavibacteriaceae bacterium]
MALFTFTFESDLLTQQQCDDVVDYLVGEHFPEGFPDDFNPLLGAIYNWYLIGTGSGANMYEYSILPGYASPSLKDRNDPKFLIRLNKVSP